MTALATTETIDPRHGFLNKFAGERAHRPPPGVRIRVELPQGAKAAELDLLTVSIAHEVNQPLAAIVTNGETCLRWLDRPGHDVEVIRELTRRVIRDARRASEIVDRVRAMAKRQMPRYAPLPFNEIIEEAMAFLRHEFQSKSIAVSLDLDPGLAAIAGDRTQLQQVIVNLVINAVQAMTESAAAPHNLLVRTVPSVSGGVCCSVEDDGPGISPAHLPQLFDGFFTTKANGMGMGLPISQSIVEAHGGWIGADNTSALGGARFSFTLPADGGE
jgi:signal transduction histidine kinase